MANIKPIDRAKMEPFLFMQGGYVLDFNNFTFSKFVAESVNINIDDAKYCENGPSKAKRLREFFRLESASTVAKLLTDLVEYRRDFLDEMSGRILNYEEKQSYLTCLKVIEELKSEIGFIEWEHHQDNTDEDFEKLSKNIQELISNNQPEIGIDRLHTFTVKFFRKLCNNRVIDTNEKPLHSIVGEYIKSIEKAGFAQSTITLRILKSSISILEAFNDVRNNQSLAHDNKLIGYDEAVLIFKNVSALINFVKKIEENITKATTPPPSSNDDLPF